MNDEYIKNEFLAFGKNHTFSSQGIMFFKNQVGWQSSCHAKHVGAVFIFSLFICRYNFILTILSIWKIPRLKIRVYDNIIRPISCHGKNKKGFKMSTRWSLGGGAFTTESKESPEERNRNWQAKNNLHVSWARTAGELKKVYKVYSNNTDFIKIGINSIVYCHNIVIVYRYSIQANQKSIFLLFYKLCFVLSVGLLLCPFPI